MIFAGSANVIGVIVAVAIIGAIVYMLARPYSEIDSLENKSAVDAAA